MTARLATVAPDLVVALNGRPSAQLRAVAWTVGRWVVEGVRLVDARVEAALAAARAGSVGASPEREALQALVDELDERAWDVQDEVDAGRATQEAYLAAFSLARAASAALYALESDPSDSVLEVLYEAQAATGDIAGVRRLVIDLIT